MSGFEDLNKLNSHLASRSYIEGYAPTQRDATIFNQLPNYIDASRFPHVARWFNHILSFRPHLRESWPGEVTKPAEKKEVKKEEPKKPESKKEEAKKEQPKKPEPKKPEPKKEQPKAAPKKSRKGRRGRR